MSDELTRPTYERVPGENMEAGVPWEIVRQTNRRKPLGVGTPEPLYLRDTRTGTVYEGGWFATPGEARCWVNGWLVAKNWPYVGGEQKEPQPDAAQRAADEAAAELRRAVAKFGPMASPHEGWAVIQEEVEELWECVKANDGRRAGARAEAIQVAAMALRYVLDLCATPQPEEHP